MSNVFRIRVTLGGRPVEAEVEVSDEMFERLALDPELATSVSREVVSSALQEMTDRMAERLVWP